MGRRRADGCGGAVGNLECRLRRYRRTNAFGSFYSSKSEGGNREDVTTRTTNSASMAVGLGLAASYADRILRGDKPADLPVQAPTSSKRPSISRLLIIRTSPWPYRVVYWWRPTSLRRVPLWFAFLAGAFLG